MPLHGYLSSVHLKTNNTFLGIKS